MKEIDRQPGFRFAGLRLVHAEYHLVDDPEEGDQGKLDVNYGDQIGVNGSDVIVRQSLHVRMLSQRDPSRVYLDLRVEIEGTFLGTPEPNLEPKDFGENHAPAILFAFTREWVHKLSSAAGPWPPILLPPVNILQLRKQAAPKPG